MTKKIHFTIQIKHLNLIKQIHIKIFQLDIKTPPK